MFLRSVASHGTPNLMSVMHKGAWRSLGIGLLWAIALSGCGILHPSSSPPAASMANNNDPAVDSGLVQSLQRQIRERNKRIEELTSQLDALKVIDQDMEERRKSSRQPATLTPSTTDRGR
jgi:TolA-binding protein